MAEEPAFIATDAFGRIDEDMPCLTCGYNLRGLEPDRACPECGQAINESLSPAPLADESPAWLRRKRRGAEVLFAGLLLSVFFQNFGVGVVLFGLARLLQLPSAVRIPPMHVRRHRAARWLVVASGAAIGPALAMRFVDLGAPVWLEVIVRTLPSACLLAALHESYAALEPVILRAHDRAVIRRLRRARGLLRIFAAAGAVMLVSGLALTTARIAGGPGVTFLAIAIGVVLVAGFFIAVMVFFSQLGLVRRLEHLFDHEHAEARRREQREAMETAAPGGIAGGT